MTATMSGAAPPRYVGRDPWGAFIGGAFVEAGDAETFAVMEPATGQQIARVVGGGCEWCDAGYRPWWSRRSPAAGRCTSLWPKMASS
jgi:hypothetical protein